jgi:hypothetical protein
MKLKRLGVVVVKQKIPHTTTTVIMDKDLLTHEQALKILAGAIEALRKPCQDNLAYSVFEFWLMQFRLTIAY